MYREYFRQLQDLNYHFASKKDDFNISEEEFKVTTLILSLSVFYNKVIMPLSGASKFYSSVSRQGIEQVSIGSYKLSQTDSNTIDKIVTEYEKMIFRFKIKPDLFELKNLEEFLIRSILIIRSADEEDEESL